MQLKTLFKDDNDAVSPVIGVILMVAITVILAAVIGTFVLGQADQLNESAPSVQFEYDGQTGAGNTYDITHAGGDDYDAGNVESTWTDRHGNSQSKAWGASGTTVSAGGSLTVGDVDSGSDTDGLVDGVQADSTIRVLWASQEGGTSSTIGQYNTPS